MYIGVSYPLSTIAKQFQKNVGKPRYSYLFVHTLSRHCTLSDFTPIDGKIIHVFVYHQSLFLDQIRVA